MLSFFATSENFLSQFSRLATVRNIFSAQVADISFIWALSDDFWDNIFLRWDVFDMEKVVLTDRAMLLSHHILVAIYCICSVKVV